MSQRYRHARIFALIFATMATFTWQNALAENQQTMPSEVSQAALPTIEALLTQAELPFVKIKAGEYKVVYAEDDASTTVYMKQDAVGKLPEDQVVYFYTMIMRAPSGNITPLLKKMAEYNDNLLIGRVGLNNSNVYYTSSFWLRNADAITLKEELMVAHYTWQEAEKVLTESMTPKTVEGGTSPNK